jgi:DNA adenine methylase
VSELSLRSPIRWQGGKFHLVKSILPLFCEHQCYCEPCCGGAAVFWAKPKDASTSEVLNDADGELVNFYRQLHRRGRRLAAEVDSLPYSRSVFDKFHSSLPASAFARAVRFWYSNRVCFGARAKGQSFGMLAQKRAIVLPAGVFASLDLLIERLRGVLLESRPAIDCILAYDRPRTLFYVDPPYMGTSNHYTTDLSKRDHHDLAACLRGIDGRFLLSYNDCPTVRSLYRGLPIRKTAPVHYSIGGASVHGNRHKQVSELLISNRPFWTTACTPAR